MALYDFVCLECGHPFELFVQGFIKDDDKRCPQCGSSAVRQKFAAFVHGRSVASGSNCAPGGSSGFR